jgi:hypothetical protein
MVAMAVAEELQEQLLMREEELT